MHFYAKYTSVLATKKFFEMPSALSSERNCRYHTFGSVTSGRSFYSESYRYGYGGKENEEELYGSNNSYDYGARILDSRLGRWFALDPISSKYPFFSPYSYSANSPLIFVDPDGKRIKPASDADYADMNLLFDEGFVNKKGEKVDGGNLFGVTMSTYVQTPGDRSSVITIYATTLSEKDFNKKLKKAKLSDDTK